MSIEYGVKDVIRIIIKHWYIVLGCVLACALVSVPLSKTSYQDAVSDYHEKLETSQSVKGDTTKIYIYLSGSGNRKQEKSLAKDILTLARVKNEQFKDLKIQLAYYESINAVFIGKEHAREKDYAEFIQELKEDIDEILLIGLNQNIEIDFQEVTNDQGFDTTAELLLQQPVPGPTAVRVIGTAGVLGFLLGLVIVMILDYIKCYKKIISINETVHNQ